MADHMSLQLSPRLPSVSAYVKLLIGQLEMGQNSASSVSEPSQQWPVSTGQRVQVVGCVVSRIIKEKYISYLVDDGSGIIRCVVWLTPPTSNCRQSGQSAMDIGNPSQELLQVGQLGRIFGKVSCYQLRKQISVHCIHVEDQIDAEILHWLQVVALSQDVYYADKTCKI